MEHFGKKISSKIKVPQRKIQDQHKEIKNEKLDWCFTSREI